MPENAFVSAVIETFQSHKRLAERAMSQVPDEKLHVPLDPNTNSIAVIAKHVSGNLQSRWTDVPQAIERSLGHTCYHVGQIIQVARIHAGESWQTLTIPKGQRRSGFSWLNGQPWF